jgi:outer membrane murein-binding lipoprotein Lpp
VATKYNPACITLRWLPSNLCRDQEANQMNKILIICASVLLIGCASKEPVKYTPPSVVAVKSGIERLKPHITNSAGNAAIKELITAVDTYEAQVDQQSKDLAKSQNDASYWHAKQIKALKELWTWRLIALSGILCVVVYVGIKTAWKFRP